MIEVKARIVRTLGVDVPDCYANFIAHHDRRLAPDPLTQPSWIEGLGNLNFVIGTTESFRSAFPALPREILVIGHAGRKLIPKLNEEIDLYTTLDTRDGSVGAIDALGQRTTTHGHFFDWLGHKLIKALLHLPEPHELFVVGFDQQARAEYMARTLHQLARERAIELDDLVLVHRDAQQRRLEIHHRRRGETAGAKTGGIGGLLIGILLNPLSAAALGAVGGAVGAKATDALKHAGMADDFVTELACLLQPGCWALFVLVRAVHRRRTLKRLQGLGGKLLSASIGGQDKAALQAVLNDAEALRARFDP